MDRTAILGDTIDYMKELLEKIKNLQQEIELDSNMTSIVKDVKPNEILIRNSPKVQNFTDPFEINVCGSIQLLILHLFLFLCLFSNFFCYLAVWGGEECRHKGWNLLCREVRVVAIHSKHIGSIRPWDSTMCY